MASKTCTRSGCGKSFDPSNNSTAHCVFHPGQPVFHEGLKSWSCCKDKNKPVMEFDQFIKIQGCATGVHSLEKPLAPAPSVPSKGTQLSSETNGKETYATNVATPSAPKPVHQTTLDVFRPIQTGQASKASKAQPEAPKPEPQDDEDVIVPPGSKCKRLACGQSWAGGENTKRGKLDKEECTYHPGTPIFHEGSKGYSCCKRRVLDFDDFLKLQGCKRSSHLFIGQAGKDPNAEESVDCRFDFYQTPTSVIVSVFGKNAAKDTSSVAFDSCGMDVDLKLPSNKRFQKRFNLYGTIDPEKSSYKILSTKCEINLIKSDCCSWSNLEQGDTFAGTMTFGVGGRTGTVGAKQVVT